MSKVSMVGKFTCVDGGSEAMEAAMADMIAASAQDDGVEIYSYHRSGENEYSFFALFSNQAALEGHGNNEAMKAAMGVFGPLLAGPPDMATAEPITAKGFDL